MRPTINHARKIARTIPWFQLDAHDEGGDGGEGGEGSGAGAGEGGGSDDSDRSFSQADLDRIVQDRLARERSKYSDYDELRAKAEQYDEIEAENQTALEKAERERDQEKAAREAAEARAQKVATRNAVLEQASEKEITDPKLAAQLLERSDVEFDDDGEPTNIGELLDTLVAAHPILTATVGSDNGEGGDGGGEGGGGAPGGSADGGAKSDPPPKDFTTASREDFGAELGKYGLRPRS